MSRQKAGYIVDLATKCRDGSVQLSRLGRMTDESIIDELTQVKGIGRWSAQMFLIFGLGRLDVFPHDDLGVRTAIRHLYSLEELPKKDQCLAVGDRWRPVREHRQLVLLAIPGAQPATARRSFRKTKKAIHSYLKDGLFILLS